MDRIVKLAKEGEDFSKKGFKCSPLDPWETHRTNCEFINFSS